VQHKPVERILNQISSIFTSKNNVQNNPAEGFNDSNTFEHAIKRYMGFTKPWLPINKCRITIQSPIFCTAISPPKK